MEPAVYAIATMDTKGEELAFVADCLKAAGARVRTVDVGTQAAPTVVPDIPRELVLNQQVLPAGCERGTAVTLMGQALKTYLQQACQQGHVAGVIGIGGSGGTALITAAMRGLEIGLPKIMVSTVASGNTTPYVGCSDITMMPAVVDVAGINAVSERILANAANAIAGMVMHDVPAKPERVAVGLTMFGVTTPCVTAVRQQLTTAGYDCLVFHATGIGGQTMEQLVTAKLIRGVLDITTTEVADEVVGGVFPAGPHRFEATLRQGIPLLLSLGALDMVNFGAIETVPESFRDRQLHVHNAQVTLMRTNVEENRSIARWIAGKLNQATAPYTLLVPERGLSLLDAPGQPFYDPAANQALFTELQQQLQCSPQHQMIHLPYHINDPEFATAVVERFHALTIV